MKRILVLGGGFAGLWSAAGAARALEAFGIGPDEVRVALVNRDPWHCIRVRNYERDLQDVRVPLDQVLAPIGVDQIIAEIVEIDFDRRAAVCSIDGARQAIPYDRLVFALGSHLARPEIPGLLRYAFDVDTYDGARRLDAHLAALPDEPAAVGHYTALIVGAGLTGIETATEMPERLRAAYWRDRKGPEAPRVVLADHQPRIGSDMGEAACRVIDEALASLGVETRTAVSVAAIDAAGATFSTGERVPAKTVIWCAGMRANSLTALFPVERDRLGRIPVDRTMKVEGMQEVFAAGDAAYTVLDDLHPSVMSCQHARPMGRFAGHNVVCDLLGKPMLPLRIDWYTTILDLGPWGAVYTEGWDRSVATIGAEAKRTKQLINCQRIYPPRSGDRRAILDAAAPVVQTPPPQFRAGNA